MKVEFTNGVKLSGKHGNLVYYERYGKTYARKPPKKSDKPRTDKQVTCNNRFAIVVSMYKRLVKNTLFAEIWKTAARDLPMNGFSYFISKNTMSINEKAKFTDLELLHVSEGCLSLPHQLKAQVSGNDNFTLSWDVNGDDIVLGKNNDRLYILVVYDENPFRTKLFDKLDICRKNGYCNIVIPESERRPKGIYCFFGSSRKNRFSKSKYFKLDW